jgi:hypothetical protein
MKINNLPKPIRSFIIKYLWFRPGIIYAYSCIHPYSAYDAREEWAYIGKTRQSLVTRHNQHMGLDGYRGKKPTHQPWSDLYPSIRVVREFKSPDVMLNLVEKFYIKTKKPLFNYMHNTKNPRRIELYQAVKDRSDRDYLRRPRRRGKV